MTFEFWFSLPGIDTQEKEKRIFLKLSLLIEIHVLNL